jgi:5-methylcytosine-specific restriction endonuclease McrA
MTLARTGFRKQTYEEKMEKLAVKRVKNYGVVKVPTKTPKTTLKSTVAPKKRKKKSDLSKLKAQLWKLCREIQIKRYGSDCYTCPSKNLEGSSRHLGHFIPSSVCSTVMRYDLDNLRVQCYSCNIHKSGNWIEYEKHLIRDGIDVQELKDRNEKTKGGMFREDWYKNQIELYTNLLHKPQ